MQIVLTNKKPNSLITIINRRTRRTFDLLCGESCTIFVENESELKEYRQSYEAFGVDISIKEPTEEFVNPEVAEEKPAEEPVAKPKRSRRKTPSVEEVPVENITVKEVEAPKEEEKVEEPKAEEPVVEEAAPIEEVPAEEPVEESTEEK